MSRNTKYSKSDYESIRDILKSNPNRNYKGKYLEGLYNLTTIKLQAIIHDLRVEGEPIVSSGTLGYRWTKDKQDIMNTYESLYERARSIMDAANGLKKNLF